ncbi:MAG: small subunit ribosomal protein S3Ae [Candidatus Methanomethylophilaceae archaeon]|nr:small subunit ribosomal protein S3Ae [Candidatus Methanomethylophilaceae archaeon]MDI3541609.1 small subunit ribosomal protein S3Ae [Candidatus Methanomethylophilaceae archaeon]HIJ00647.1 30S ribosomal protein S3ae [Candidatus Methanomethylophilaceae archaeon]
MAVKKGKGASRKVRDKWKSKEWYTLHAPRMFNEVEIGETPSADPAYLIGRTAEVTVHDLTGDFSKMHIKLKFQVSDVQGNDAYTTFIGHDLTSDYIRRLTRRKRTKTDHVVDVTTKDGFVVRVKPVSIADRRIQSSQESAIRSIMGESIKNMAAAMTVSELVKHVITGDMARDIAMACRSVVPIKRVEIGKTEILQVGEGIPEAIETTVPQSSEENTESEERYEDASDEEAESSPDDDDS